MGIAYLFGQILEQKNLQIPEWELRNFSRTWSLDEECWAALVAAPLDVQRKLLAEFAPKPGTRDIKRLFFGFLKSLSTTGGSGGDNWTEAPRRQQEVELLLFTQHWSLDDECVSALMAQSPDIKQKVMTEFAPKPGTRNLKSLFFAFLRSVSRILQDTGRYCRLRRILQDTAEYCGILQDTAGYCRILQILQDTARYCRILRDRFCRILQDTAG